MMMRGMFPGLLMIALALLNAGCQNGARGSRGYAHDTPSNSIDGYAQAHGVSRAEAAKRLRAQLVSPDDSHFEKSPVVQTSATEEQVRK